MNDVFNGLKVEDIYGQLAYPLKYLITEYEDHIYILDLKNIIATCNSYDQPIDAKSVDINIIFTTNITRDKKDNNWFHFMRNTLYQIIRNNYPKIIDENCNYVINNTGIKSEDVIGMMYLYKIKCLSYYNFKSEKITINNLYEDMDNCLFAYIPNDNMYEISKDLMNTILYCLRTIRDGELHT